jgi:hypothetical protein
MQRPHFSVENIGVSCPEESLAPMFSPFSAWSNPQIASPADAKSTPKFGFWWVRSGVLRQFWWIGTDFEEYEGLVSLIWDQT